MTITLRTQSQTGTTTKGSTLTHAELDDNFIDLLTNKIKPIDVRGDSGTQLVGQTLTNEVLQVLGGTGISTAVTSDSAGQAKIIITNTSSGATITDDTTTNATRYIVFDDVTTGSLSSVNVSSTKLTFNPSSGQMQVTELSTDSITSKSANSAIVIAPDGTGDVHLNTDSVRIGDNNTDATLVTRGTGDLILTTNEGSGTQGVIRIYDGANGNIELTPNGTGQVKIDYSLWPASDGTASQVLSTNGSGVLSWVAGSSFAAASPGEIGATTPDVGNFTDLKVKAASSTVKELQLYDQDNTNYVGFKSPTTVTTNKVYVLPSTDGSATHVLQTDGAGNLSWVAQSSFAAASPGEIGATTPADASFLTLNVKSASSVVKEFRLHDQDNSNYVGFKAPVTVGTNRVWTLPSADGTNGQVLQTDGTGTFSFATPSVSVSTGVSGLGSGVATFLATPSSSNLISAITDETGTGALVFATSPTLVTPALGTPASGNLSNTTVDGTNPVGFRDLPAVGTKTTSYTLAVGDVGKYVQVGSGGSITIPNSTFAEGDVVVIANNHTAAITVTCTITDAYIGGTNTDKATVSLATRGVCNILFLSSTACIITGNVS